MAQKKVPALGNFFLHDAFRIGQTSSRLTKLMSDNKTPDPGKSGSTRGKIMQDPNAQISEKLREFYQSVQEEPIPDRFLDLLEKLDEAEEKAKAADKK